MPDKKTGTEVTDPALLAQLNAGDNTSSQKQEVTDPALLAQLNGDQTTPQKKVHPNLYRLLLRQTRRLVSRVVIKTQQKITGKHHTQQFPEFNKRA